MTRTGRHPEQDDVRADVVARTLRHPFEFHYLRWGTSNRMSLPGLGNIPAEPLVWFHDQQHWFSVTTGASALALQTAFLVWFRDRRAGCFWQAVPLVCYATIVCFRKQCCRFLL